MHHDDRYNHATVSGHYGASRLPVYAVHQSVSPDSLAMVCPVLHLVFARSQAVGF